MKGHIAYLLLNSHGLVQERGGWYLVLRTRIKFRMRQDPLAGNQKRVSDGIDQSV